MDKTVLITGATSGIGKAAAGYLKAQGYDVILTGRNKEKLQNVAEAMGVSTYVAADLMDHAGAADIFAYCGKKEIKLDGMVHCAGIEGDRLTRLCDYDYLNRVMQINYFVFMELCRQFSKKKYSNDGASIVVMSSVSNMTCRQASAPYACAKSAVDTAVTVMSKEFIKRGVRVNAIKPALVDTPFISNSREMIDDIKKVQPFGYIEPLHVAYMIEYLLSEKAKYITGAHIPISAGMEL